MKKLSRNDPCPCGSGKKYKKCCLNNPAAATHKPQQQAKLRRVIVKTPEQITGIRNACRLASQTLDMVGERITAGVTTEDINTWVHDFTLAHGATPAPLGYHGFPKSVCTSLNHVICHGIPDGTVLQDGDIINVDVTPILDGYYGDSSRMFIIGDASEEAQALVRVAKECLDLGIEQVKPGAKLGNIGHAIQQHAEGHGFSVVRDFAGHGTGVEFHEAPQVVHYGQLGMGMALRPNMTFTIEPMINSGRYESRILADRWTAVTVDGSLSAQWEHTILVTDTGAEVLTVSS
ncbi:methionyl aminopeptidase [Candidatus Entotheonella palauensis]|nr:methionyl aminopeptidase [Candidatus Entotheonella palauensis]